MDDLKIRIKALLDEIEYVHLKRKWREGLIAAGTDESKANMWVAEIGHVLEAYQSSLEYLVDLVQETNPDRVPQKINDWAAFTRDISVFKMEDAMSYLQEQLAKYLPPEPDDEDEQSS